MGLAQPSSWTVCLQARLTPPPFSIDCFGWVWYWLSVYVMYGLWSTIPQLILLLLWYGLWWCMLGFGFSQPRGGSHFHFSAIAIAIQSLCTDSTQVGNSRSKDSLKAMKFHPIPFHLIWWVWEQYLSSAKLFLPVWPNFSLFRRFYFLWDRISRSSCSRARLTNSPADRWMVVVVGWWWCSAPSDSLFVEKSVLL